MDDNRQATEAGCARGNGARPVHRSTPPSKVFLVLSVSGWLLATLVSYVLWGTISEVRFRAAIAPGHSDREVRLGLGSPDSVVQDQRLMRSGRLGSYLVSTRPIERSVLVYYRFGHAVLVYIDSDGFVDAVYWARRK